MSEEPRAAPPSAPVARFTPAPGSKPPIRKFGRGVWDSAVTAHHRTSPHSHILCITALSMSRCAALTRFGRHPQHSNEPHPQRVYLTAVRPLGACTHRIVMFRIDPIDGDRAASCNLVATAILQFARISILNRPPLHTYGVGFAQSGSAKWPRPVGAEATGGRA